MKIWKIELEHGDILRTSHVFHVLANDIDEALSLGRKLASQHPWLKHYMIVTCEALFYIDVPKEANQNE
jgi:hypothetical protein